MLIGFLFGQTWFRSLQMARDVSLWPLSDLADVRPESEIRRTTDIAERPPTVSINEYAPRRPADFAGAEANSGDFHETLFILAFARDLPRAHRA
jgi:hypothetical protein